MSREIRFRAWEPLNAHMVYFDGFSPYRVSTSHVMLTLPPEHQGKTTYTMMNFDAVELMQWTGVCDVEGIPIYEGDICRNPSGEVGIITYGNGMYVSQFVPPYDWDAMARYDSKLDQQEVIGNIYEHKHLLEEVTIG